MAYKRIAVVPGDGIGVDVTAEAVKVMHACADVTGRKLHFERGHGLHGRLRIGISVPPPQTIVRSVKSLDWRTNHSPVAGRKIATSNLPSPS